MTATVTPDLLSATHKDIAADRLRRHAASLVELSQQIHEDPELAFAEHRAAQRVAAVLGAAGFTVTPGAYGLPTAVEATYGRGDVTVTLCAEYDALPEVGHACGHNVIAAAGVGAAIGLAAVADDLGLRVKLLGTPAEEHGGGKIELLRAGAFEDTTLSLMVHPANGPDRAAGGMRTQSFDRFAATFLGRAAHAAAAPQHGINAGAAATITLVAIGLLRQQLPDGCRLNAFVAQGGDVTNIIPARSVVEIELRSVDLDELADIKRKVLACIEAGAIATGCTVTTEETEPGYLGLRQDPDLARFWDANLRHLGRDLDTTPPPSGGSTDMGNVSQVVPSLHPTIAILGATSPPHTLGFAAEAASPAADQAVLDGAAALIGTVIDAVSDPAVRADLRRRQDNRTPGSTAARVQP